MPRWRGQYREQRPNRFAFSDDEDEEAAEAARIKAGFFGTPSPPSVRLPGMKPLDPNEFLDVRNTANINLTKMLLISRLYVLIIQHIGGYFEWKTDAFQGHREFDRFNMTSADLTIQEWLLPGLMRWDALQFMFVAEHGYELEHSLAFLPGLPWFTGTIGRSAAKYYREMFGWVHTSTMTLLAGLFINTFVFLQSGSLLFMITLRVTRSKKTAMIACILFAYNPSSIFFTAYYSESIYTTMTWTGIFLLMEMKSNDDFPFFMRFFVSAIVFMLTSLIRSNSVMNIGYMAWYFTRELLWPLDDQQPPMVMAPPPVPPPPPKKRTGMPPPADEEPPVVELPGPKCLFLFNQKNIFFAYLRLVGSATFFLSAAYITLLLWIIFGHHIIDLFCNPNNFGMVEHRMREFAVNHKFVTRGDVVQMRWCRLAPFADQFSLPIWYPKVQTKYWGVGLLGYWQLMKIPCFLMAAPALVLTGLGVYDTLKRLKERRLTNFWLVLLYEDHLFPYAVHASLLALLALFYINVEVYTRILFSSTPFIYIYLAQFLSELTTPEDEEGRLSYFVNHHVWYPPYLAKAMQRSKLAYFIGVYFAAYFVLGTLAHSMFLPFT